jgi:hypothetical protein
MSVGELSLLIFAALIFLPTVAFAAGDEVPIYMPIAGLFFFLSLFYVFGHIIGTFLRSSHAMIALLCMNILLLASVSWLEGFDKMFERLQLVLVILVFFNLATVIGLLVGRGKFLKMFAAFKRGAS